MAETNREEVKIIHPKERPPRTVSSIFYEKCSVQPSLLPGVPKQLSFELRSSMCPPSRPRYRRAGMCKRQDTIKGILEYDICHQTKHQTLLHATEKHSVPQNTREDLRYVRDRSLNDHATRLAERLLVEDSGTVLKKKPNHQPPWTKENLLNFFDLDKHPQSDPIFVKRAPSKVSEVAISKQMPSRPFGEFKRRFQVQPIPSTTQNSIAKTKLIVQSSRVKACEMD